MMRIIFTIVYLFTVIQACHIFYNSEAFVKRYSPEFQVDFIQDYAKVIIRLSKGIDILAEHFGKHYNAAYVFLTMSTCVSVQTFLKDPIRFVTKGIGGIGIATIMAPTAMSLMNNARKGDTGDIGVIGVTTGAIMVHKQMMGVVETLAKLPKKQALKRYILMIDAGSNVRWYIETQIFQKIMTAVVAMIMTITWILMVQSAKNVTTIVALATKVAKDAVAFGKQSTNGMRTNGMRTNGMNRREADVTK